MSSVPSQTLQEVGKRVELAFKRYISGDSNQKRSGKPRFKSTSRFRSMVFEGAKLHSCSVGGKWLYLVLPKLARSLAPDGVLTLKGTPSDKDTASHAPKVVLQDKAGREWGFD